MITEITLPSDPDWPARIRARAHHIVSHYESCTQSIVAAFMEELGIENPQVRPRGRRHARYGLVADLRHRERGDDGAGAAWGGRI
jgi:hypothetical protein